MTAFEKWKRFIEQLIYFECPADNEKLRLRAELTLIEKTNCAELFQAIYDTWQALFINGVRCYLAGEAEEWYIFRFLDMTRENPLGKEMPKVALSKVTFVIPRRTTDKAERFVPTWKLPDEKANGNN